MYYKLYIKINWLSLSAILILYTGQEKDKCFQQIAQKILSLSDIKNIIQALRKQTTFELDLG